MGLPLKKCLKTISQLHPSFPEILSKLKKFFPTLKKTMIWTKKFVKVHGGTFLLLLKKSKWKNSAGCHDGIGKLVSGIAFSIRLLCRLITTFLKSILCWKSEFWEMLHLEIQHVFVFILSVKMSRKPIMKIIRSTPLSTGCINLNAIFDNLKSFHLIFHKPIKWFTVSLLIQLMLSIDITFKKIFDLNLTQSLHSSL